MRNFSVLQTLVAGCFIFCAAAPALAFEIKSDKGSRVQAQTITSFNRPWAMTFLPDATMLVTTRPGAMFLVSQDGGKTAVGNIPQVAYGGQGGLGDIILHPGYKSNNRIYLSYAEAGEGGYGAVVITAKLDRSGRQPRLTDIRKIWTQTPKTSGQGHYSHRMAFATDGKLFITAGERQELQPAQSFTMALGKIIRLNDDGSTPSDNPWQDKGELAKTFWSMGHRNPLGIHFDAQGRLWAHEMGPRHGDELNLIVRGRNYGWPAVSNGRHYSGLPIPNHNTRPDFEAPRAFWVPAISPAGFVIYSGKVFPQWRGNGFIGGLSSRSLVRVEFNGTNAREAERFGWGKRVREIEQGPNGALWVLEDGNGGRLLKLTP